MASPFAVGCLFATCLAILNPVVWLVGVYLTTALCVGVVAFTTALVCFAICSAVLGHVYEQKRLKAVRASLAACFPCCGNELNEPSCEPGTTASCCSTHASGFTSLCEKHILKAQDEDIQSAHAQAAFSNHGSSGDNGECSFTPSCAAGHSSDSYSACARASPSPPSPSSSSSPSSESSSSSDADSLEDPASSAQEREGVRLDEDSMRSAKVIQLLGSGAFGTVELVEVAHPDGSTGQYARKTMKHTGSLSLKRMEREVHGTRAAADSPFAVRVLGSLEHSTRLEIFYEYASGGSLEEMVERARAKRRPSCQGSGLLLPVEELQQIAFCTLHALAAMHRKGVGHLDVKPGNLLIGGSGYYLLADMGNALPAGPDGQLPGGFYGSMAFVAPEQYKGQPFGLKADVYSVGAMLCACGIWPDDATMVLGYKWRECELPAWVPPDLRSFIESLTTANPDDRPSAAQALEHAFLQGLCVEDLVW